MASWWKRFFAFVIDFLIMIGPILSLLVLKEHLFIIWLLSIEFIYFFYYCIIPVMFKNSATIGMKFQKIQIVNSNYKSVSFREIIQRYLVFQGITIITIVIEVLDKNIMITKLIRETLLVIPGTYLAICFIGYFWKSKIALHDYLSNTYVINNDIKNLQKIDLSEEKERTRKHLKYYIIWFSFLYIVTLFTRLMRN